MRFGVVHEPHGVAGSGLHARDASASAMLGLKGVIVHALDVVVAREGDEDILLWDEVFVFDVASLIRDFGASLVAEALFDFLDLLDHQIDDVVSGGEEAVVLGDVRDELIALGGELVLLHALEAAERHAKDGRALFFIEPKGFAKARGALRVVFGGADEMNDQIGRAHV